MFTDVFFKDFWIKHFKIMSQQKIIISTVMLIIISFISFIIMIKVVSSDSSSPVCSLIDNIQRPEARYFVRLCDINHDMGSNSTFVIIRRTLNNKADGLPDKVGVNLLVKELHKISCILRCHEEAHKEK
jgi:hypothetical protein